jgi:16S rRNA (uracil1498-N3)-methyltransferase
MARFFLPKEKIHGGRGVIDGQELAHLSRVLRLRAGDSVTVFDDSGWEHDAVIDSLNATQGELKILRSYETGREPALPITLAVGLTKGEKFDFVVEKATELGVQRIAPFTSKYAVPKLDAEKIGKRTERWRKIAVSAAKQCGRTRVPEILPLCDFHELIKRPWPDTLKLIFWEKETDQSLQQIYESHRAAKGLLLAIGPEGGFTMEEAAAARSQNFAPVQIGRRILRAETAALAALALAQYLWGDLK